MCFFFVLINFILNIFIFEYLISEWKRKKDISSVSVTILKKLFLFLHFLWHDIQSLREIFGFMNLKYIRPIFISISWVVVRRFENSVSKITFQRKSIFFRIPWIYLVNVRAVKKRERKVCIHCFLIIARHVLCTDT